MKTPRARTAIPPTGRATDLPRLLQQLRQQAFTTGQPVPMDVDQLLRLVADVSGEFPVNDAQVIDEPDADGRPQVIVSRNGLTGPTRTLPPYWNDVIRTASGEAGDALRGIVAAIQTAILQAEDTLTRAGRPWDCREWSAPSCETTPADPFAAHVLGFLGPEIVAAIERIGVPADAIIRHAGLFLRPPTAEGLGVLLSDLFGVPVRVLRCGCEERPFIRLRIGPLRRAAFDTFRPDRPAFTRLVRLTRLYLADGPRFDVELRLHPEDVRSTVNGYSDTLIPGWNYWGVTPNHTSARAGITRIGAWQCRRIARSAA